MTHSDNSARGETVLNPKKLALYGFHFFIIANFLVEICYATYMVFVVFGVEGNGPLYAKAKEITFEHMMIRRAYATETWLAVAGLCIYLALTEIGPRLKKIREGEAS